MAQTFAATISDWVRETEGAAEAVFKQSAQEVLSDAQTPVGAGGSMPFDTGFLAGSLTAGVNVEPGDVTSIRPANSYVLEIAPALLGDTIKARWTAEYAAAIEYGRTNPKMVKGFGSVDGRTEARGFVRKATQNWQQIVAGVEARLAGILGN